MVDVRTCPKCGTADRYPTGGCKNCQKAYRLANPDLYAAIAERQREKAKVPTVGPCSTCGADDRYKTGGCKPCAKARRIVNKEEQDAYSKAWREAHPEKCRVYGRVKYRKDPSKMKRAKKAWELANYPSKLLQSARDTSRTYGWVCNLEVSDIIIPERCPLLGIVLDCRAASRANNLPSIDRIDSSLGYVKGNVWVISWRANKLKSDGTLDELRGIVAGLENFRRLRLVGT